MKELRGAVDRIGNAERVLDERNDLFAVSYHVVGDELSNSVFLFGCQSSRISFIIRDNQSEKSLRYWNLFFHVVTVSSSSRNSSATCLTVWPLPSAKITL